MYEKKTMMVREGTTGYGSSKGYYNFFYPDMEKECTFVTDCVIENSHWLEHNNLMPIKAKKGFVKGEILEYKDYVVLWVSKEDIEKY